MPDAEDIGQRQHDLKCAIVGGPARIWCAALVAFVVEVALVLVLIANAIAPLPAAVVHAGVVAALGNWVRRSRKAKRDLRYPFMLLATTAVLGPLGPAGLFLTMACVRLYSRSAVSFEEWYASLFPEEVASFDDQLYHGLQSQEDPLSDAVDLVPFIDLLTFGTREQKQAMIALVTNHFQPAFAPVLRMALNDSNGAIRVQAATAMTKIENHFLQLALELSRTAEKNPDSPTVLLSLARHFDSYAFAGFLDEKRETENRDKAVSAYERYLQLEPGNLCARAELGRLLVRKGDYDRALRVLGESIEKGDVSPQIILWYMECLFHLRRLADLRDFAHKHAPKLDDQGAFPIEARGIFELWGPGGHPDFTAEASTTP